MSLKILKAGILDTIQDAGRFGYQHLGINTSGAMDILAMQTANLLLGNEINEPVLEMFFPAPDILFEQNAFITITGANFSPMINGDGIKINRTVMVKKNTVIQFPQKKKGQCCYLSVQGGFRLKAWLNSCSTNLKAGAGGYKGRKLQKDDVLEFKSSFDHARLKDSDVVKLQWRSAPLTDPSGENEFFVLPGHEWNWLTTQSQRDFFSGAFSIAASSDRMGYRITGKKLISGNNTELVSSAVNFGTIQLLPMGELIILMADSQTTGGYPRIGHVISAHLPKLAQKQPGEKIQFRQCDLEEAERFRMCQQKELNKLRSAAGFKREQIFKQGLQP